jgi:hypothetical protein
LTVDRKMSSLQTPINEGTEDILKGVTSSNLSTEPNTVAMLSTLVDSLSRMHRVSDANQSFAAELDVKLRRAEEAATTRAAIQNAWEKDFEDKITRQFEAAVARAVSRRSAEYETKLRELESKLELLESLTFAEVGSRYFSAALSFAWRGSVLLYSGLSLLVAPCTKRLPAARKRILSLCCASNSTGSSISQSQFQSKPITKASSKTTASLAALAHQQQQQQFSQDNQKQQDQYQYQHQQPTQVSRSVFGSVNRSKESVVQDNVTSPAVTAYISSLSSKSNTNSTSLSRRSSIKTHQLPLAWKNNMIEENAGGILSTLHNNSSVLQDAESASITNSHPSRQDNSHLDTSFQTINERETTKSNTLHFLGINSNDIIDGRNDDSTNKKSKSNTPPSLSFSPSPIPSEVYIQQHHHHQQQHFDQTNRRLPAQQQPQVIAAAPVARRRPQRPI